MPRRAHGYTRVMREPSGRQGHRWTWIVVVGFVFAGLQVVPVERSNPPVAYDVPAPDAVQAILRRACYDCHSHETRWPWYAWVAPASWLVAYDVDEARSELNFSTWRAYRPDERERLLDDLLEEIDEDHMPPWYYRLLHPSAALSAGESKTLRGWVESGGAGSAGGA